MKLKGMTKGLLVVALIAIIFTVYDFTWGKGGDAYEVVICVFFLALAAVSHFVGRKPNLNGRP
ncbi:hypothetical protein LJY25_14865 [Hymenobacter sp. BT175]|uniref:hypothetical protein n=1 Tax=Hymenobacter translucens TaxID=2886507 RepID=UPI001D0E2C46|nr:hypothetical protein [Hymenobacter translucens]MCC2547735.1 hypothetical protein [Hymenobacter translucens]